MTWHDEVLAEPQRRLLRTLGPLATKLGYYLAGGTAIALQLGHRESIDFDYFALNPEVRGPAIVDRLREIVPGLAVTSVGEGTFNGVLDGVKVSFFVYPYPLLEPALVYAPYDARLATLRDLAAMKLSAIADRGLRKDFIDLDFLMTRGTRLTEMAADYRAKFGVSDLMNVRVGLVYFDDADAVPMPRMILPFDWDAAKRRIARGARELA